MGSFQEGSKDLHSLLETLADCRLKARGLARGREGTEREKSIILSELKRELSTVGARAVSSCLLGRVASMGEGHRQAAKRGEVVKGGEGTGRRPRGGSGSRGRRIGGKKPERLTG